MSNHDSHYLELNKQMGFSSINVMETLITRENIPVVSRLNITLAQKHLLRCGLKKDNSWEQDIEKTINYLTRALTGEWKCVD